MASKALHPIQRYLDLRNEVRLGRFADDWGAPGAAQLVQHIRAEAAGRQRYAEGFDETSLKAVEAAVGDVYRRFGPFVAETLNSIVEARDGTAFPIVLPEVPLPSVASRVVRLPRSGLPETWVRALAVDYFAVLAGSFTRAITTTDVELLRICPICTQMFYARRPDQVACSPAHANVLRVRRSRAGKRAKVKPAKGSRAKAHTLKSK